MYGGAAVAHGAIRPGSPGVAGFGPGSANPTIQPVIRAPIAPPPVFHQAPFRFAGYVQPFFGGGAPFFPNGFQFGSPQGYKLPITPISLFHIVVHPSALIYASSPLALF
jgi:hypothetical protein